MALSANTVWEVRTAGNDTNGGGFVAGASGTDYSQQDSKNTAGSDISTTDAVANGTTTITSATANFGTTIVGNIVYFQGGTGSIAAVWRQVTARASTTSITIDASIASSTGMTMNIGGALASLGMVGASIVANNKVYIKTGTYSVTSASTNVAAGCYAASAANVLIEGYSTTRGDLVSPPTLQASGISTFTLLTMPSNGDIRVNSLILDGASLTSSRGLGGNRGIAYLVKAINCTNGGIVQVSNTVVLEACSATGCSTAVAIQANQCYGCEAYSNTIGGFASTSAAVFDRCLSYANSGASSDGFSVGSSPSRFINCVAYNNGRHGFTSSSNSISAVNCIAEAQTAGSAVGFNLTGQAGLLKCAVFNNTTNVAANTTATFKNIGQITGTASFFVNPGSGNFALNTNANGGGLARAAGYPGTFPATTTVGFLDVGGAEHSGSGGLFIQ